MSWFLAFAGFSALVILHELGHFIVAKKVGMRVERFFLFFPPKLWSVQRGETEYGIGAIPAGGFVKITGMNPDEELTPEVASRAYYNQPVWKRIAVILAGPAMNLLVCFAILFVLAFGVREATTGVARVTPGTPAAGALRAGDRVIAIDGVRGNQVALARQLGHHRCAGPQRDGCRAATPAKVELLRAGHRLTLEIRPFFDAAAGRQRLGFEFASRPLHPSPLRAAGISAQFMGDVTTKTVGVIARLFDAKQREQVSGIVGGYEATRQAIQFDARQALTLIAVISLSLAVINLFPFLPLDGGHIFWSLVEKVRGRPVSFRVMERAGAVGFALVLMLFFVGLSNDIGRLTGQGFGVH
ncbi:MAG: regulator of sigma protease [Solirubrobacterales bacterium]|jgi:regulator of sigma E protease|nr:regulator of sigma protease [Solirubrobacterales bacterium]